MAISGVCAAGKACSSLLLAAVEPEQPESDNSSSFFS
jgi:hypothetical protein